MATRRSARLAALASTKATAPAPPSAPAASRKRKASQTVSEDADGAPSTPRRRRAIKNEQTVGPLGAPTPAAVKLMTDGTCSHNTSTPSSKPKPASITRLADPNRTNAVLRSPNTSRIITSSPVSSPAKSKLSQSVAPSPTQAPSSTVGAITTTENILQKAVDHLISVEPRLKPLIDKYPCRLFSPEGFAEQVDPFEALASSIIAQQVSGAAAKSIKAKFIALFKPSNSDGDASQPQLWDEDQAQPPSQSQQPFLSRYFPSPAQVAATPLETLRTAGLSQRKAEYLHSLSQAFLSGTLSTTTLASAPDEELITLLTSLRGIGRWTAEMFAVFALKRMDVFSTGDLGVQRGLARFMGKDVGRLRNGGGERKGSGSI
ncbi:uncharacterized protein CTHT_0063560 [Thermochaetoides thermophila DSM 1495]|uniref:HhH-GPD domain-containing protein n=1 Tax=Chaetomium thermophilum (strain DSM 1495 / CBS 144.50 / IMI 039719) TaxID=759272 RepID=G0SEF5_CHATD|nr:hypothetical protein CTHT_0063560 [Thermochaetoides thermophila DSM 1495]EGS18332.1 hypothetical protein CTHT_0063560 [Thermochaetoides thermophila DSM 1495]